MITKLISAMKFLLSDAEKTSTPIEDTKSQSFAVNCAEYQRILASEACDEARKKLCRARIEKEVLARGNITTSPAAITTGSLIENNCIAGWKPVTRINKDVMIETITKLFNAGTLTAADLDPERYREPKKEFFVKVLSV